VFAVVVAQVAIDERALFGPFAAPPCAEGACTMLNTAKVFPAGPGRHAVFSPDREASASNADAVFPPDFDEWPSVARWLFKEIVQLPSWKTAWWASPSDEYLRERRACRDRRTIRRMRAVLIEKGEFAFHHVKRGELLPSGERARTSLWVYVPGAAMRARLEESTKALEGPPAKPVRTPGLTSTRAPVRPRAVGEIVRRWRKERPPIADSLAPDRSRDQRSEISSQPAAPPSPPPTTPSLASGSTSFHSKETKALQPDAPLARLATMVGAHYAAAIGARWRYVHADIVALIVPLLDGMNGPDDSKVTRACAVVDRVVDEARRLGRRLPTPRFVFNPPYFWRRLERIRAPERGRDEKATGIARSARGRPGTDAELHSDGMTTQELADLRALQADLLLDDAGTRRRAA
jgi:hypothetical protein